MQTKQFSEIKTWDIWSRLWEENDIEEIAISLLHVGSNVSYDGLYTLDKVYERAQFYLEIASNADSVKVKDKAYQVLLHHFLREIVKRMNDYRYRLDPNSAIEVQTWNKILGFFARGNRDFSFDEEPYKSEARDFVMRVQLSLRADFGGPFSFPCQTKNALMKQKNNLAKALINVRDFKHIVSESLFEAVPFLKKEIVRWCWDYTNPGEDKMKQMFPEGKVRWQKELENPKSKAFRFALHHVLPKELAPAFMELVIKRDVALPVLEK